MRPTQPDGAAWPTPTPPAVVGDILRDTQALGFTMACEPEVGALLATLAAGKPGGRALEIGTGTGVGTAWLLSGLNAGARLVSVDNDPVVQAVAARHLGHDPRLTLITADGGDWLLAQPVAGFDLIFANSWPGKYTHLDPALACVAPGGFYVVDDLLPQPTWPADHAARVPVFMAALGARTDFRLIQLPWASGVIVACRISG